MLVRFIKGVQLRDRWYRFWKYTNCFSGRDVVAWFLENGHASDLSEALALGATMINHNVFEEYRGYHAEFKNSDNVFFNFTKAAHEFVERSKTCRMQRHPRSFSSAYSHPSICSVSGGYYGEKNIEEKEEHEDKSGRKRSSSQGPKNHRRTHSERDMRVHGLLSSKSAKESISKSSCHDSDNKKNRKSFSSSMSNKTSSSSTKQKNRIDDNFVHLTRTQCVRRAMFCIEMAHVALAQNADRQAALHLTRAQTWANLALSSSTAANMHDPDTSVKSTGTGYNTFPKKNTYKSSNRRGGRTKWSPELRDLKTQLAELRERLKHTSVPRSSSSFSSSKETKRRRNNDTMDPDTIQRLYGGKNGVLSDSELEILMRGSHVPGGAVAQPWVRASFPFFFTTIEK